MRAITVDPEKKRLVPECEGGTRQKAVAGRYFGTSAGDVLVERETGQQQVLPWRVHQAG